MTRDEIAKIIRDAQGCGIGNYAADGSWETICCNDERLKGDKHHYFEDCDCSKAAGAMHAALAAQQDGETNICIGWETIQRLANGETLSFRNVNLIAASDLYRVRLEQERNKP